MRTHSLFKVALLSGLLAMAGCASKVAAPDQFFWFFKRLLWLATNNVCDGETHAALG
ncbi:protein YdcL [Enterobacter cancerogenus]|uniref:Protein YdcL n=1 Tax=Enterobacter cancerogenus TaxID=69218 RepID=A0A484YY22_9ENTR|nr:protein YdcL [Enterobacter cancerogenus]